MSVKSDIRDGIVTMVKQALGTTGGNTFSAEVLEVNVASRTCKVLSISSQVSMEYEGVQLMPEVEDGLLYTPAIGSTVIVTVEDNLQPYVSMWSAIDAVYYVAGGSTLKIDRNGLELDGSKFFGVPKVAELTKQYNAIENDINQLKTIFAAFIVAAPTLITGIPGTQDPFAAYLAGTIAPYAAAPLVPTTQLQIENPKVQHGDGSQ